MAPASIGGAATGANAASAAAPRGGSRVEAVSDERGTSGRAAAPSRLGDTLVKAVAENCRTSDTRANDAPPLATSSAAARRPRRSQRRGGGGRVPRVDAEGA